MLFFPGNTIYPFPASPLTRVNFAPPVIVTTCQSAPTLAPPVCVFAPANKSDGMKNNRSCLALSLFMLIHLRGTREVDTYSIDVVLLSFSLSLSLSQSSAPLAVRSE